MNQMDLDFSRALRDDGISRALAHANHDTKGWADHAYSYVEMLARRNVEFLSDDVRVAAEAAGLPPAPDPRAWGGVILRAVRAGLIKRVGWANSTRPECHARPGSVWKAK